MAQKPIIRVFPRRTSMTPNDDLAFIGGPPMSLFRPTPDSIAEVHISCVFTWDSKKALWLKEAWGMYYPKVKLGGGAFGSPAVEFVPGMYVKHGCLITSYGCNNHCPWCLVPEREGRLKELPIHSGYNIIDNNLLQCSKGHITQVFEMLKKQPHRIDLSGGLDSRLLTDSIADDLRSLRIRRMFFACDTKESIKPLERAKKKLYGLGMEQLRCFVMLGYDSETTSQALERLEAVYHLGFMPFAQLYQPPDKFIQYSREWKKIQKEWSRPPITKAIHKRQ